jgi:formate dehydrogenase major subunit
VHGDPVWGEPDAEEVLRRINGYHLSTGEPVGDYRDLRADGSTSSGCWIYSGVFKDPRLPRRPAARPRPAA